MTKEKQTSLFGQEIKLKKKRKEKPHKSIMIAPGICEFVRKILEREEK